MCTSPILIPTRKRYLSCDFHEKHFIEVPCGNCSSCHTSRQRQMSFRFSFEAKRSKYIYSDTLTYSDNNLPHIRDFFPCSSQNLACFSRNHIQLFLKRLRRKLSYHLKLTENVFKYAIFSEYGADQRYTHRPHYHILFFVNFDIDPLLFSRYVSECWQYGRTEGFGYKNNYYILHHNTLYKDSIRLTNYVTKYLCKSSLYYKSLQPILDDIIRSVDKSNYNSYVDYKKAIRHIKNTLSQFSMWSHHLGDNFLNTLSNDDIIKLAKSPFVPLPNYTHLTVIPLPLYYVRKLFYTKEKFEDGYFFNPNDYGLIYLTSRQKSIESYNYYSLKSMIQSINYSIPDNTIMELSHYLLYKRYSNLKPFLYLTPPDVINTNHLVTYYRDKDIDSFGQRIIKNEENIYSYYDYLLQNSYTNYEYEKLYNDLLNTYNKKFPNDKFTFVNEFRNKIKSVMTN